MNMIEDLPTPARIQAIARRAGMERSLYLGESIGHMLQIAGSAFESVGATLRRALPRARRLSPQVRRLG